MTLTGLVPEMRVAAKALFDLAHFNDRRFVVTSVRRSYQEQARLFAASQAGRNHGLPAAPPGLSFHELGRAFDMARIGVEPLTDPYLPLLGAVWKSWGGTWRTSDPVHFQA